MVTRRPRRRASVSASRGLVLSAWDRSGPQRRCCPARPLRPRHRPALVVWGADAATPWRGRVPIAHGTCLAGGAAGARSDGRPRWQHEIHAEQARKRRGRRGNNSRGAPGARPVEGKHDAGGAYGQYRKSRVGGGRMGQDALLRHAKRHSAGVGPASIHDRPRLTLIRAPFGHGRPALRVLAFYRVAALASRSVAIRTARHADTLHSAQGQILRPWCHGLRARGAFVPPQLSGWTSRAGIQSRRRGVVFRSGT